MKKTFLILLLLGVSPSAFAFDDSLGRTSWNSTFCANGWRCKATADSLADEAAAEELQTSSTASNTTAEDEK